MKKFFTLLHLLFIKNAVRASLFRHTFYSSNSVLFIISFFNEWKVCREPIRDISVIYGRIATSLGWARLLESLFIIDDGIGLILIRLFSHTNLLAIFPFLFPNEIKPVLWQGKRQGSYKKQVQFQEDLLPYNLLRSSYSFKYLLCK